MTSLSQFQVAVIHAGLPGNGLTSADPRPIIYFLVAESACRIPDSGHSGSRVLHDWRRAHLPSGNFLSTIVSLSFSHNPEP